MDNVGRNPQIEFSSLPRQEQIAEAERMDERNRQRFERARTEGRCMVMLEEIRFGTDGRMRSGACLRSVARIEKAQEERRAQEDDGSGRAWQRKFIDDEGNISYDEEADRAAATYWEVREAKHQRNRGCDAEIVASTPRSRPRQSRGNSSRTRGSRRNAASSGGGDPGDGSGESDPDGDHPPAAGEIAERSCEECGHRFRKHGGVCERCRKKRQRDRGRQTKLAAEPRKPRLVTSKEIEAEQNHDQLVWLMETTADGLPHMAGCYGARVA